MAKLVLVLAPATLLTFVLPAATALAMTPAELDAWIVHAR